MSNTDLFENYDLLPEDVKNALCQFNEDNDLYKECESLLFKLQAIGYSFEYGLDGIPYNLKRY